MSQSRVELMYEQILTEFEAIKTSGGYRTDPTVLRTIRRYDKASDCEIGIEMGDSELVVIGGSEKSGALSLVFDENVPIYISGIVRSTIDSDGSGTAARGAAEALGHDIKRVAASLLVKYAVSPGTAGSWNIWFDGTKPKLTLKRAFWNDEQRAYVEYQLNFVAHLRNQDEAFT
jgi:hypothetical protein